MAVFNFSKITNTSSTKDYSYLVDALSIKENQLSSDGKLSPGDYKLLKGMAQQALTNPGLTPVQRSQIQVKISGYDKDASVSTLNDSSNVTKSNNEYKDDLSTISQLFASDPSKFLTAKSRALQNKISDLSDSINTLDSAGSDSSTQSNQLQADLTEYQDTLQALDDIKTKNPNSDFGVYATTNSKGEVVNLKIERQGAQTGYIPTNGKYGGLSLYGKENRKDASGKIIFQLGSNTFTESNSLTTGPDGTASQKVLIMKGSSKGAGGISINPASVDVDPKTIKAQGSVPTGGWVEGDKGFLYQRQDDGSYKKYVNANPSKLGITPNDIIKVPRSMEAGISSNVSQTVDASAQPIPTTSSSSLTPNTGVVAPATVPTKGPALGATPQIGGSMNTPAPTTGPAQGPAPVGRPQTGTPTSSAPSTPGGVAGGVINGAKSFFGNLFGK